MSTPTAEELRIAELLDKAAREALPLVNAGAEAFAGSTGDSGVDLNLYVYPSGDWCITTNCELQDHNTLAQASAEIPYADAAALSAALAETLPDDGLPLPEHRPFCNGVHPEDSHCNSALSVRP